MKVLTREQLHRVLVKENHEPLSEITENGKIVLLKKHKYLSPFLRTTVRNLLEKAANNLPDGLKLLVVTAHRPIWMQQELWDQRVWQITKRHPLKRLFSPEKFKRIVGLYTAPPGGSSHQCGAAVDVAVLGSQGERLDMGTKLTDFGERCHTENNLITNKQKENRKILYDAMIKAGFSNYPLEWWHYSYGDMMWAAYTERKECFYGPIS